MSSKPCTQLATCAKLVIANFMLIENIRFFFVFLLLPWGFTTLAAEANIGEVKQLLRELVDSRNSVRTFEVVGTVSAKDGVTQRFHVWVDGSKFRCDKEVVDEFLNTSQESGIDRVAIVGEELRRNHSIYGAELKINKAVFNTQITARLFGFSVSPLEFLTKETTIEETVVGQLIQHFDISELVVRKVENIDCVVISARVNQTRELFVYFDLSLKLKGCEVIGDAYREQLSIQEAVFVGGQFFPKAFHTSRLEGGNTVRSERVVLDVIRVNEAIAPSIFEFSGLGLVDGGSIDVKNGSLGIEPVVVGTFKNGQIVASSDVAPQQARFTEDNSAFRRAVGVIFIALAIFLMIKSFRKKA